jgi:hypothetical protein
MNLKEELMGCINLIDEFKKIYIIFNSGDAYEIPCKS